MSKFIKSLKNIVSPKTLLKLIILFQVLSGRYFNLNQSKPNCVFIKLYCIAFSFIINILMYTYAEFRINFTIFVYIEYLCLVITSLLFTDKYFINYYNTIRTNDRIIGFKKVPLFTKYSYAIIFISVTLRAFLIMITFLFRQPNLYTFVPVIIMLVCVDLSHIVVVIMFSILHTRMKLLRYFVESNPIPINIIGQNELDISIKNIRKSLYYYNNLLDNMEFVDKYIQYQIFVTLMLNFPKLIFVMSSAVTAFYKGTIFFFIMLFAPETAHTICDLSYPGIIAELIIYEVDKIRESLTTQLGRCSDESLRFELSIALQYVSLRPFSCTICRSVPLNIYLPFTVISLCITYAITLLQLTHFSF